MGNSKNIKWELEQYNDGELIGLRILDRENGDTLFDTGLKGCIYEEEEENAKLIAAAPEMLSVLENIIEYWNGDRNDKAMFDALNHIIYEAEEAVKKATE